MLRALGRLDGSTALALSMHTHQVMVAEWKRRVQGAPTEGLLKRVADEGLRIVSSGGSDRLPGSGRAEKADGGYRIFSGRKVFSSGAPDGDIMNTSAIYDDGQGAPVVLHFAMLMKDPGVTVLSNWDALGMRGTGSQDGDRRRLRPRLRYRRDPGARQVASAVSPDQPDRLPTGALGLRRDRRQRPRGGAGHGPQTAPRRLARRRSASWRTPTRR